MMRSWIIGDVNNTQTESIVRWQDDSWHPSDSYNLRFIYKAIDWFRRRNKSELLNSSTTITTTKVRIKNTRRAIVWKQTFRLSLDLKIMMGYILFSAILMQIDNHKRATIIFVLHSERSNLLRNEYGSHSVVAKRSTISRHFDMKNETHI